MNCSIALGKDKIMANEIRTSKEVAKKASKQLRSSRTSETQKSIAASGIKNTKYGNTYLLFASQII